MEYYKKEQKNLTLRWVTTQKLETSTLDDLPFGMPPFVYFVSWNCQTGEVE